jgi:proton-dependent oligopeptide transporter, POT family
MTTTPSFEPGWWGHPRGLSTLFFTEMWERFSYYGMRAILVLFMTSAAATGGLGLTDASATAIYGLYTAGVYLLALPGGWIADRLIGQRRAVLSGGILIAAGHFTLAVPAVLTFYLGLALIVLGTGLLKPNISAMVGDLYPEGGARRDAGFSIYYMGINLGAFGGPLVCGYLGEGVNWHLGFGAAGVGMLLGLIQYVAGGPALGAAGTLKPEALDPQHRESATRSLRLALAILTGLGLLLWLLQAEGLAHVTLVGFVRATGVLILALALGYLLFVLTFGRLAHDERQRVLVIGVCFLASAVFWAGYEQAGSSMTLFAERLTDRVMLGWVMPASWLQSVNPIFIIALAPAFGSLWVWLGSRNPSIPVKFACGLMTLGLGFLVVAWGSIYTSVGPVSSGWLVTTYFLHTVGELCLSPIGLSSITKLSPTRYVGQMMGIWFMGAALGNLIAGLVAGLIETFSLPVLFGTVALTTAGAGVVLLLFSPAISRMIGNVR